MTLPTVLNNNNIRRWNTAAHEHDADVLATFQAATLNSAIQMQECEQLLREACRGFLVAQMQQQARPQARNIMHRRRAGHPEWLQHDGRHERSINRREQESMRHTHECETTRTSKWGGTIR